MNLLEELRANPRLRLGLGMIAAVIGLYGLLALQDHQDRLAGRLRELSAQLSRLSSPQAMGQWPHRARQAESVYQRTQKRLWRSTSIGLAQAELQDWLRLQLQKIGAQNPSVRIAEAGTQAAFRDGEAASAAPTRNYVRVDAQLGFGFSDPQMLVALLAAMGAHDRTVQVESLVVKAQRVDMRVAAWFLVGAAGGVTP